MNANTPTRPTTPDPAGKAAYAKAAAYDKRAANPDATPRARFEARRAARCLRLFAATR